MNIMPERTWEYIGRPAMIPSLGGIGLFKGKLVNLCGRLTQTPMTVNGTLTEEDFEIIKFVEDSAPCWSPVLIMFFAYIIFHRPPFICQYHPFGLVLT
jgi:hypothetical protein